MTLTIGRPSLIAAALVLAVGWPAEGASPAPSSASPSACRTLPVGPSTIHIDVEGVEREVLVDVPDLPPDRAPVPLVIGYHGYSATGAQLAETAGLGHTAGDAFLVAYPQGIRDRFGQPDWSYPGAPGTAPAGVDDMRLTEALLELAASEGCVDPQRVIVMGHSKGGGMAQAAACALADRVAGVVLVAAIQFGAPCQPDRPVPVLALHAVDDPVLPYLGGHILGTPSGYPDVVPVERAIAAWADRNHCASGPVANPSDDGGAVLRWEGCDAPVVLHRLARGGHAYTPLASELVREAALRPDDGAPTAGRPATPR